MCDQIHCPLGPTAEVKKTAILEHFYRYVIQIKEDKGWATMGFLSGGLHEAKKKAGEIESSSKRVEKPLRIVREEVIWTMVEV